MSACIGLGVGVGVGAGFGVGLNCLPNAFPVQSAERHQHPARRGPIDHAPAHTSPHLCS